MKNIYTTALILLTGFNLLAQNDTLFFENFNDWPVREADSIFFNYDEDQMADANGLPGGWFVGNLANGGADSLEKVALSSSWLVGAANGNRNYLMLPGVYIGDSSATLSWRSAPALGNLYMDGYTVAISTDSLVFYYFSFSGGDTLMHFAQNTNDNENNFSSGIQHSNFDMNAGISPTGVMQYPGLLSPWSVDLSAYAGQKVYILFAHNSDDDNYIALDDILLTGTYIEEPIDTTSGTGGPSSIDELTDNPSIKLYPNPTSSELIITSNIEAHTIEMYSSLGQLVYSESLNGSYTKTTNVSNLPQGIYSVVLSGNESRLSQTFVKQ